MKLKRHVGVIMINRVKKGYYILGYCETEKNVTKKMNIHTRETAMSTYYVYLK